MLERETKKHIIFDTQTAGIPNKFKHLKMVNNKTLLIGLEPIINEITNEITNQLTANFTALLNEKIGTPKQTEIMTRKEVSELLQKDYSTLFRWKQKGILVPTFIDGSIYYYRSDIDTLLEKNKGI